MEIFGTVSRIWFEYSCCNEIFRSAVRSYNMFQNDIVCPRSRLMESTLVNIQARLPTESNATGSTYM